MPTDTTKRRIVAKELRRRNTLSCDYCKSRRIKCDRNPEHQELCSNCSRKGLECRYTHPRKQRIYGSVETLSLRYRYLDSLVRGLFPNVNVEDLNTLSRIASDRNIPMPEGNENASAYDKETGLSIGTLKSNASIQTHEQAIALSPKATLSTPSTPATAKSRVTEEKLYRNSHGARSYLGPCSSFAFMIRLRQLFKRQNVQNFKDQSRASFQEEFARKQYTVAIEGNITGNAPFNEDMERVPEDYDTISKDFRKSGAQFFSSRQAYPSDYQSQRVVSETQESAQSTTQRYLPQPLNQSHIYPATFASFLGTSGLVPDHDIADKLVEAYFNQVHGNLILFHRGIFQMKYEQLWRVDEDDKQGLDVGWLCCLFMVFVLGGLYANVEARGKIQSSSFAYVKSRTWQLLNTSSLSSIQALMLLQLYQHSRGERNAAWMLLGCATRMAVVLGMHREGASINFSPMERELRRRVWATIFVFEQNLCLTLGRPSAMDGIDMEISTPNEALLDGGIYLPAFFLEHSIGFARLIRQIREKVYPPSSSFTLDDALPEISVVRNLLNELDNWNRNLPTHLNPTTASLATYHRRPVLLLHLAYCHAIQVITRPFLLRKVALQLSHQSSDQMQTTLELCAEGLEFSRLCWTHALKGTLIVQELWDNGLLDGQLWVDVYYGCDSCIILLLSILCASSISDTSDRVPRVLSLKRMTEVVLKNAKLCTTMQVLAQITQDFARVVGIDRATQEGRFEIQDISAKHSVQDGSTYKLMSHIIS